MNVEEERVDNRSLTSAGVLGDVAGMVGLNFGFRLPVGRMMLLLKVEDGDDIGISLGTC